MKEYGPKSFNQLIGLPGFSEESVRAHVSLYREYVDNTNLLAELMRESLKVGTSGTIEWAAMKRRFAWEFNGMRLHEQYFGNMTPTPKPLNPDSRLYRKIEEDYGRYELWEQGFIGTGSLRGVGWVLLVFDAPTGRLFNLRLDEDDSGLLVGTQPLLVMDVFEHAFLPDYGLDRRKYIEAFFRVINWDVVEGRLTACLKQQSSDVDAPAPAYG
jgi:Fe-Mn family superoxide dismutase